MIIILNLNQKSISSGPSGKYLHSAELHKTLSYTWAAYGLERVVTWTLTPTTTGTRLHMEQSGFRPDQQQAYQDANGGWQRFLVALAQVLARME